MDKKLMKEIEEFDNAFEDGVYVIPRNEKEPRVKVRALSDYCRQKGIEPKDLSREDMERFLEI